MANRKERIAKGIELLDDKAPGWCERVDLKTLDLRSPRLCVLGQSYREEADKHGYGTNGGYGYGKFTLGVTGHDEDFGFDKRGDVGEEYFPLTQAWKRAIREHCRPANA